MSTFIYDAFISHASEDKSSFVAPLCKSLKDFGSKIWYDEYTLKPGNSLSESIDRGLANSRYGIVVFSPTFFEKYWTKAELRGLRALEETIGTKILPIWLNVDKKQVAKFSPILADTLAIIATNRIESDIAIKILEIIRPDLREFMHIQHSFISHLKKSTPELIKVNDINKGPVMHEHLSVHLQSRIRFLQSALKDVYDETLESWIDNFKRDWHPHREVLWWEFVASTFFDIRYFFSEEEKIQVEIFNLITRIYLGLNVTAIDLAKLFRTIGDHKKVEKVSDLLEGAERLYNHIFGELNPKQIFSPLPEDE